MAALDALRPPHINDALAVFEDHDGLIAFIPNLFQEVGLYFVIRAVIAALTHKKTPTFVFEVRQQPLIGEPFNRCFPRFLRSSGAVDDGRAPSRIEVSKVAHFLYRRVIGRFGKEALPVLRLILDVVQAVAAVGERAVNIKNDAIHKCSERRKLPAY